MTLESSLCVAKSLNLALMCVNTTYTYTKYKSLGVEIGEDGGKEKKIVSLVNWMSSEGVSE